MHQQIHAVGHARIQAGETDELLRIARYQAGGNFVIAIDADRVFVAQRKNDGMVYLAHGLGDRGRVGPQRESAGA